MLSDSLIYKYTFSPSKSQISFENIRYDSFPDMKANGGLINRDFLV